MTMRVITVEIYKRLLRLRREELNSKHMSKLADQFDTNDVGLSDVLMEDVRTLVCKKTHLVSTSDW